MNNFVNLVSKKELKIAVCVLAYKRQNLLRSLLLALERLKFRDGRNPTWECVIVDNDGNESSRTVWEEFVKRGKIKVRYVVEEQQGIPLARNKALEASLGVSDFICFIDDDEMPDEYWLDELLRVQQKTGAKCVYGPVVSILPKEVPVWIAKGRFFDSEPFEDGDILPWAATNNLMLDCEFLKTTGLKFDQRMRFTGGSDTLFLEQAQELGLKIIGASKAIVREHVPLNRANARWLIMRRFRGGICLVLSERLRGASLNRRAIRGMKGIGLILRGIVTLLLDSFRGQHVLMHTIGEMARGLGVCTAMMGLTKYEEYAPDKVTSERKNATTSSLT